VAPPAINPDGQLRSSGAPREAHGLEGSAFEALFHGCAADVHAYAFSLLGDRASAEDVTALAFERLYRARSRLDGARGTPRAWLFTIARNAALDELRRRRRQPPAGGDGQLAVDQQTTGDHQAERAIEQAERRASVRVALAGLPARERELVLLKFHGQLSNAELARVLGISESNAGTRVHRALNRLRESCAGPGREEFA
jgi:RNA polymerase sigma factor (sigma-70 family)